MKNSIKFNASNLEATENWVNESQVAECVNLYKHYSGDHYVLEYANEKDVFQLAIHDGDLLEIEGIDVIAKQ